MKGATIASVMMMLLATSLLMAGPGDAFTCGEVSRTLLPCVGYLTGATLVPLPACCAGVWSLKAMTPTTQARRQACYCIKRAAGRIGNIRPDAASNLPGKCRVRIGVPISVKTNCATIP